MIDGETDLSDAQFNALQALLVFAVDPIGCGGIHVHGLPGPGRDAVLRAVRRAQPENAPFVRIPCHVSDDRLLGGLDLASTLAAGKPVAAQGLLATADSGAAVFVMAERLSRRTAASIITTIDTRHIQFERDGFSAAVPARFTSIVLDESLNDDEPLNPGLADRLAFYLRADDLRPADVDDLPLSPEDLRHARENLKDVDVSDRILAALCQTALGLGITSIRSVLQCVHAARVLASLAGTVRVDDEQAAAAVRLVLAHRAVQLPPLPEESEQEDDEARPQDEQVPEQHADDAGRLDDVLLDAALAALPPGLLDALSRDSTQRRKGPAGRAGARARATQRGRPVGERRATGDTTRLNVLATIKAAAPWQKLRNARGRRVEVRRDDFRITRRKSKTRTTNIFVVDASGSSAAQRLGEVKGAVELLLGDCYVRRDQVALIGFRGDSAELLLPPTRSLVRARRELANLPGGGATPLAGAIDAARLLAQNIERQGQRPVVILLTDGRGNVGRDGTPGHPDCVGHTEAAARELAETGVQTLLIDVSKRPRERGRELARQIGGHYLPLPFANAETLSHAVKASTGMPS